LYQQNNETMNDIREERIDNYIFRLYYDENPTDPREDYNLSKMVCFHKRYNLGDDHDFKSDDFDSWDEMEKHITRMENPIVIKPLYLYDHGGITIKTSSFSCQWDSGQIGFVYIRKQDVRDNFSIKRCGQNMVERCDVLLEGEVDTYDKYLQGQVYGYEICKVTEDGHQEGLERCGDYLDEEQCVHDGMVSLNWFKENDKVMV
jgi:hypothetical protein